jgi:hypothetical protein
MFIYFNSISANSGVSTRDLPVSYTLPPELLSLWESSKCRPGISLIGADLRPELMINNVRATVFPHLQQQVQSSIALSMSRQAMGDIELLEQFHSKWKCKNIKAKLIAVQAVKEEGHEPRRIQMTQSASSASVVNGSAASASAEAASSPITAIPATSASASDTSPLPPISMTENLLSRWYSGHLWSNNYNNKQQQPLSFASGSATANTQSTVPSSSSSSSPILDPSGFVISTGVAPLRFLSSERWLIQRCDNNQLYRIHYYGNGDAFYAQVVPTNLSGLISAAWVSVKEILRP